MAIKEMFANSQCKKMKIIGFPIYDPFDALAIEAFYCENLLY
jgi:hypothetical protein